MAGGLYAILLCYFETALTLACSRGCYLSYLPTLSAIITTSTTHQPCLVLLTLQFLAFDWPLYARTSRSLCGLIRDMVQYTGTSPRLGNVQVWLWQDIVHDDKPLHRPLNKDIRI